MADIDLRPKSEAGPAREEYGRPVRRLRDHWLDAAIIVVALDAALEFLLRSDPDAPDMPPALAALLGLAVVLPLLARRTFPFAAPAAVWLLGAGFSFVDEHFISFTVSVPVAGSIAAYLLGNLRDDRQGRLGLVIVLGGAAIITYNGADPAAGEYLFVPAQFAIFWLAGYALRERSVRAEAAEAAVRLAAAEERTRIARELHDVVAHAVSVMVLQVGAVRHGLPPEREDDREALTRVEQAGRTALSEMRSLLDSMRTEGEEAEMGPQPTLSEVDGLLSQVRRAGLSVELHVEGQRAELPAPIELSAFRIVQEGLTNALKHSRASRADVFIRYGDHDLEIEVRDNGRGAVANGHRPGYGLVGVRERVKVYGGEMTAGAAAGGGFTLRTRFPLAGTAA
jgi:signal transduction histidine kinase